MSQCACDHSLVRACLVLNKIFVLTNMLSGVVFLHVHAARKSKYLNSGTEKIKSLFTFQSNALT